MADVEKAIGMLWAGTVDWLTDRPALHELRVGGIKRWIPAPDESGYRRAIAAYADRGVHVSLAPRVSERGDVHRGCCLWVRVEGRRQVDAMRAFPARPSLVLRDGDLLKATAVWMLEREVDVDVLADLNRRLAHVVGAVKKHGAVDYCCAAPGALVGKHRVGVSYAADHLYPVDGFLRLRRPPESKWNRDVA